MARTNPALERLIEPSLGETLPELQFAGAAIADLLENDGWEVVNRIVDAEIKKINRTMSREPLEHVEYAHRHGRLSGLETLSEIIPTIQAVLDRRETQAQKAADAAARGA